MLLIKDINAFNHVCINEVLLLQIMGVVPRNRVIDDKTGENALKRETNLD